MSPKQATAAALTAIALVSASLPALAAGEASSRAIQGGLQAKPQAVQRLVVRSPQAARQAFEFAARQQSTALEITCHPPTHDWCANDFQAACDKNGGGLSSDPDGGITCSMPD